MKIQLIIFSLTILFSSNLFSQNKRTDWDSLKIHEAEYYKLEVPYEWRDFPAELYGFECYYIAEGLLLPPFYEEGPVIVRVFMTETEANSLEELKDSVVEGYDKNPDRVFEDDFEPQVEKYVLSSGEDTYLVSTKFFRKSKNLYQNRYDLVLYCDRHKKGYILTLSIQHNDGNYEIAKKWEFEDIAKKISKHFWWKP